MWLMMSPGTLWSVLCRLTEMVFCVILEVVQALNKLVMAKCARIVPCCASAQTSQDGLLPGGPLAQLVVPLLDRKVSDSRLRRRFSFESPVINYTALNSCIVKVIARNIGLVAC